MAQVIGYFENDVTFEEGPFVICNPCGNGWRIEVEQKEYHCPVLPDMTIYPIKDRLGMRYKTNDHSLAERVCDSLNEMVRNDQIVLSGRCWVAAP